MKSQMGIESGGSKGSCGTHDGGTNGIVKVICALIRDALLHNATRPLTSYTIPTVETSKTTFNCTFARESRLLKRKEREDAGLLR
jgi:hypothetical protein